jgi:hypothetical protein
MKMSEEDFDDLEDSLFKQPHLPKYRLEEIKSISKKLSDLVVKIYEDPEGTSSRDEEFRKGVCALHYLFAPLAAAYVEMYNHVRIEHGLKNDKNKCLALFLQDDQYVY